MDAVAEDDPAVVAGEAGVAQGDLVEGMATDAKGLADLESAAHEGSGADPKERNRDESNRHFFPLSGPANPAGPLGYL
jgi:hypothetical protein